MPSASSLHDKLTALLPTDLKLSLYHICHNPIKTQPLYNPPPNQPPQPTTLETHFLAVSYDGILCFVIEILIYISTIKHPQTGKSHKETTFFVSKADSSGYLPPSAASFYLKESPEIKESTLRTVSGTFLEHIVREHRLAHPTIRKTTISLFARAQGQYLFPDSEGNPTKHILSDRGLIKWWCRVLDPILQNFNVEDSTDKASAYLLVPGFDKYETAALFPPKTRQPSLYPTASRWVHGHPLKEDRARKLTIREVIPHFPDDPKARFLDELDSENVLASRFGKQVNHAGGAGWATIKTFDQFWEFMSFRQECSSGASTGFIWIVIEKKRQNLETSERQNSLKYLETKPVTDADVASEENPISTPLASQAAQGLLSSQNSASSQNSFKPQPESPSTLPTSLRFSVNNYRKVLETLMCGEFGSEPVARLHSRKWVDGAITLLGNDLVSTRLKELKSEGGDWGMTIVGQREVDASITTTTTVTTTQSSTITSGVNMLTVRKRHKGDDNPGKEDTPSKQLSNSVNVLGSGSIRKKPKLDDAASVSAPTAGASPFSLPPNPLPAATMLAPGLIRKKPKPDAVSIPTDGGITSESTK